MANLLAEIEQRQPVNLLAEIDQKDTDMTIGEAVRGTADIIGSGLVEAGKSAVEGLSEMGGLVMAKTPQEAIEAAKSMTNLIPEYKLGDDAQTVIKKATEFYGQANPLLKQVVYEALRLGQTMGDKTFEATGSPLLGAAAGAIPGAIEALPVVRTAKPIVEAVETGARKAEDAIIEGATEANLPFGKPELVDNITNLPTPAFDQALKSRGLTFTNVEDEIRNLPANIKPNEAVDKIIVTKLQRGDKDNALAPYRLGPNNRIEADELAQEAIRQGFREGDIQSAKMALPGTKQAMRRMVDITKRLRANSSLKSRPTDIVGESVLKRFNLIRETANNARKDLDQIARRDLKGLNIDTNKIANNFFDELDNLDVDYDSSSIPPKINFSGSQIAKDRTSQRVIKDVVDLLSESKRPDALRAHKLKRQLDSMIDFRKKSAGGLTEAGRNLAKSVRASLNDSIRAVDDDYAAVNDILSESIGAMDEFQRVLGPSIDVFADGANKAIGQDLRGLLSNRKSRVRLENALNSIEETAQNLGGEFEDDIRDLVVFANTLDDQFGAVARTSLKGEVESAIQKGARGKAGLAEAIIEKAGSIAEEARGINDENAFKVIDAILKR